MRSRLYLSIFIIAAFIIAAAVIFFHHGCRRNAVLQTDAPENTAPLTSEQADLIRHLDKKRSGSEPEPLRIPLGQTPLEVLREMTKTYQTAKSYCDRGYVQIIGKTTQPDYELAPYNCIVAYQKENETAAKIRLEINRGVLVSNGENCYAQIQNLPEQVLVFPTPQKITPVSFFSDLHIYEAMETGLPETIIRFAPQLILLFAGNPLNTLLPSGSQTEFLAPQYIKDIPCDLIRISHSSGVRILWVSRKHKLLLRLDYLAEGLPVPEGIESITLIRIELEDAAVNRDISPEAFQMMQPENAKQTAAFQTAETSPQIQEAHRMILDTMEKTDYYAAVEIPAEDIVRKKPAQPRPPKTFSLEERWIIDNLTPSGNIAVLPQPPGGNSELPVLITTCDGNQLISFDADGSTLQKIKPEGLHGDELLNIVQTGVDDAGKPYIAAAFSGSRNVHFYDVNIHPVSSLPGLEMPDNKLPFPAASFHPTGSIDSNAERLPEPVVVIPKSSVLSKTAEYAAALPDGSVYLYNDKGELLDSFAFGEFIAGIAFTETKGRNLIIVAGENSITAWEIIP